MYCQTACKRQEALRQRGGGLTCLLPGYFLCNLGEGGAKLLGRRV